MPMPAPRRNRLQDNPGSSAPEIAEEPGWGAGHQHRIGFGNRQDRAAGFTHDGDHGYEKRKITGHHPPGSGFVVRAREDWIKKEQAWLANIKQREKDQQQKKEQEGKGKNHSEKDSDNEDHDDESEWRQRTAKGGQKHHGAYGKSGDQQHGDQQDTPPNSDRKKTKTEAQKLREKYSPEEITLLRHLQQQLDYSQGLQQNESNQDLPVKDEV